MAPHSQDPPASSVPAEWLQRPLTPDPDVVYPVERVEVRDPHRGPLPWLGYIALRVLQGTVGRLPRALRNGLGRVLVTIIAPLDRRHTRAALDFVRSAFPGYSEREAKALVRSAWLHLWDLTLRAPYAAGEILHKPLGDAFRVSMDPRAQELAAAGSPVVFVGCHVGHWELAGIALATLGFQPIYAVGKAPRNDYLSRSMQKAREAQGGRMLPRKDAMKSVPGVLRGGGSVIFLLDHRARSKPVYAPFFGRPAACERSASVLFRRLGVPIVFYACYGGEGPEPYEIVVGPVLEPADLAGLGPEAISARVNAEFETQIRRRPKQYFWLHDRYQHTPRTFEELAAQESGANTADAAP